MAIESISREFEVFMREMIKVKECAHENIESELRRLIRTTVNSCATMYGFSANEALAKLDSNGNILPQIAEIPNKEEIQKRSKELEKAEKALLKQAQKTQKAEIKAFEKTEAIRRKEFEKAKKNKLKEAEKTEKANEISERNQMKEQDIASKAINQKKKKPSVTKRVKDDEIHILFQAVPLIEEINSIRNIKVQKKLSAGVKLARQILDI
jgi:hypothetical protein